MENSNTNIRTERECTDPRKDRLGFPCGWKTPEGKCNWKKELVCKPIKIGWYVERNLDKLGEIEL